MELWTCCHCPPVKAFLALKSYIDSTYKHTRQRAEDGQRRCRVRQTSPSGMLLWQVWPQWHRCELRGRWVPVEGLLKAPLYRWEHGRSRYHLLTSVIMKLLPLTFFPVVKQFWNILSPDLCGYSSQTLYPLCINISDWWACFSFHWDSLTNEFLNSTPFLSQAPVPHFHS